MLDWRLKAYQVLAEDDASPDWAKLNIPDRLIIMDIYYYAAPKSAEGA